MQDLRAELTEMLDESEWEWLIPHARREAIVVVTGNLDLVDVGVAIAGDNVASVQHWISESLIYKPSQEQLTDWNSNQQKRFNTLIVQPYVLIQELAA
ncbi:DUF2288 domain-containing protein [Ancylothrix sp. C2]|uniref:DUF2288 domain-containing protein n=1 Tax=Ancylothrix sp. D3o TaxID=2953691 RepID=UPI0021BA8D48|nr:DUF2288 domain-containing protein [Ancylothrix sp. D3o]MCT7952085.1 DUF2288 domain-containing protein [Ancylothrix sp. D3o]